MDSRLLKSIQRNFDIMKYQRPRKIVHYSVADCLLYWDPTPFIIVINFTTTRAQRSFIMMGWLLLRVHCNSLLQKLAKRLKSTDFCGVKHFYFITRSFSVTYDRILERSRDGQSRYKKGFVAEEVVVVTFSHHY